MIHRAELEWYPGPPAKLAADLAELRYDALAGFLHALAARLAADGDADADRGRPRLSAALRSASGAIASAAADIDRAWAICAPRM